VDASNPTARALRCLELLQDSPGITANRLADKLGVSDRAARRYVAILREAGVPVESVRGRYGGYHVGRGLRLPPLMFSAAEALGLVMAVLDGHHDASDPTDPVGGALGKIMRALPEPVAAQAEAVRQTTAPAPDRAAARPDSATTTALVQACSNHRRVRLGATAPRPARNGSSRSTRGRSSYATAGGTCCVNRTTRAARRPDHPPGRQHQQSGVYAKQFAAIPAPYRILKPPELQEAARALGQRLLAASENPRP